MIIKMCPKCKCHKFKFNPPTAFDAAFVTCAECNAYVGKDEIVEFQEDDFDVKLMQPGGPWRIELDQLFYAGNTTLTPIKRVYVMVYKSGDGGCGPTCEFRLPVALSDVLWNEYSRGGDEVRNQIKSKLGLY